jgi:N6-adenosine-specific RNA methylase IME4/ParB-like chromosome segregation protein Spo0J
MEHTPPVGVKWHDYANLFPWLAGPARDELKADIKKNGVLDPIVFLGDAILDGRNRYEIARELGIEYPRVEFEGDDPLAFVVSKNLKRRDLSASQRAAISLDIEKEEAKAAKVRQAENALRNQPQSQKVEILPPSELREKPAKTAPASGKARDTAAKAGGTSARYVQDAKAIEKADPVLLAAVKTGEKTIPQAKQELKRRAAVSTAAEITQSNKALSANDRKYGVIYADPPWSFQAWSGAGTDRAAENHYPTMDQAAIEALPVADLAADDCVLFLWAVMPQLPEAFAVIKAWGFEFKTCGFVWVKQTKDEERFATGMGYWTRANAEICLLATKGKPSRLNADVQQVIMTPRMEHSKKPDEVAGRIERLVPGPYLEMFARQQRAGWDVWGNQSGSVEDEAA